MYGNSTPKLSGLELRYALVVALVDLGRLMSVDELVRTVESWGFEIPGRPGKTVSDALRWERRRGRVTRVSEDRYRCGHVPRSSLHRMRHRLAARRAALGSGRPHDRLPNIA